MKNLRLILWVGLVLAVLVNYSTWVAEFAPRDAAAAAAAQKAAEAEKNSKPLGAAIPQVANVPAAGAPAAANGAAPSGAVPQTNGAVPAAAAPTTAATPAAGQ